MANGVAGGSFLSGVFRVVEAGERLLVDQAELARLESRGRLISLAMRFGLIAAGVLFLITAWIGAVVTAIVAFDTVPLATRIGVATLIQLAIGAVMIGAARREKRESQEK